MDISAFMTGYFVGIVAGVGGFVFFTVMFGSFLPKLGHLLWRLFANIFHRLTHIRRGGGKFNSRRSDSILTPAE